MQRLGLLPRRPVAPRPPSSHPPAPPAPPRRPWAGILSSVGWWRPAVQSRVAAPIGPSNDDRPHHPARPRRRAILLPHDDRPSHRSPPCNRNLVRLPVGRADRTLWLLAGGGERADWVRNLRRHPAVTIRLAGDTYRATARVVPAGTAEDALARRLLCAKYQGWREGQPLSDWGRTALPVACDLEGRFERRRRLSGRRCGSRADSRGCYTVLLAGRHAPPGFGRRAASRWSRAGRRGIGERACATATSG